jgi:hypothetical protein
MPVIRNRFLARGLVGDFPLAGRQKSQIVDTVRRVKAGFSTSDNVNGPTYVTLSPTPYGPGVTMDGGNVGYTGNVLCYALATADRIILNGPLTILTRLRFTLAEATGTWMGIIDAVDTNLIWKANANSRPYFEALTFPNSNQCTGNWLTLAFTRDASGLVRCYVDGKADSVTGTYAPSIAVNAPVGTTYGGNKYAFRGSMSYSRFYSRDLAPWIVRLQSYDPWILYRRSSALETLASATQAASAAYFRMLQQHVGAA